MTLYLAKVYKKKCFSDIMHWLKRIREHKIFLISLYIKAVYGLTEAISGIVLIILGSRHLSRIVQWAFGQELLEDPKDVLGNLFMNAASSMSVHVYMFISLYMIVHGIANAVIAYALIKRRLWFFPVAGVMLTFFIIYQLYLIIRAPNITMILLTMIDMTLLVFLKSEYDSLKKSMA
jgi:uncharacterized membrane protein